MSVARSKRRQRCRPTRQSRPSTLLDSCSLCGHSLATRVASSDSGNAFSGSFMRPFYQARRRGTRLKPESSHPALSGEGHRSPQSSIPGGRLPAWRRVEGRGWKECGLASSTADCGDPRDYVGWTRAERIAGSESRGSTFCYCAASVARRPCREPYPCQPEYPAGLAIPRFEVARRCRGTVFHRGKSHAMCIRGRSRRRAS